MLHGRRLDEALEHVDGSRYALVHAVAKRARQITLWLTADPADLRSEEAPPPAPGELVSRDPVALSEAEILQGEVRVRWDPDGTADERELPEPGILDSDALLVEGLPGEEEEAYEPDEGDVPAPLTAALEPAAVAGAGADPDDEDEGEVVPTASADVDDVLDADLVDDVDDLMDEEQDELAEMGLSPVEEGDAEEPLGD